MYRRDRTRHRRSGGGKSAEFNEAMTAQEAFEKFRKRYKVAAEYSEADALKIVALRYEMERVTFR